MDHWYNWPQVVWDVIVIFLLLSSLWFIWNNCIHQIPSSYTSMSSNIRNCPIIPELLYYTNGRHEIMEGGTWQTSQIFRASSPRSPLRDAGELWSSAAAATGIKGFSQLHTSPRLAPPVRRPSWHSQHNISHFQIHFFNSVCPLNNLSMFMLNFFREMWTSEIISHLLKCIDRIDITRMLCFVCCTYIHSKHIV